MPTVDERYAAATDRVRATMAAFARQPIGYALDGQGAARWYNGRQEAAALAGELAPIETRWLRASTNEERERAARDAEQLADRAAPIVRGCERDAGFFDYHGPENIRDEMQTVGALIHQLDADIRASHATEEFKSAWKMFVEEYAQFYKAHQGWFDRLWFGDWEKVVEYRRRTLDWSQKFIAQGGTTSTPTDNPPDMPGNRFGQLVTAALIGGGLLAAYKIGSAILREREARREPPRQSRARSLSDAMNDELAATAERAEPRDAQPLGFGPRSMCPVCHQFKNLDENGRVEPHEYPTGGMCPGESRLPLWPFGKPRDRAAAKQARTSKQPQRSREPRTSKQPRRSKQPRVPRASKPETAGKKVANKSRRPKKP